MVRYNAGYCCYFLLPSHIYDHCSCEVTGIDKDVAKDYCWIHGSSFIPQEYQAKLKCIVEQDGVMSADEAPDTSYYQWVTFMFCIQVSHVPTIDINNTDNICCRYHLNPQFKSQQVSKTRGLRLVNQKV